MQPLLIMLMSLNKRLSMKNNAEITNDNAMVTREVALQILHTVLDKSQPLDQELLVATI